MQFATVVLLGLLAVCTARKPLKNEPHLLVLKSMDAYEAVLDKPLTVSLNVFNVGQSAAHQIEIDDSAAWPVKYVKEVEGKRKASILSLGAGLNKTVTYQLAPILATKSGKLPASSAKITYSLKAEARANKVVYSNTFPSLPLFTAADFERKHSRHVKEWVTFLVLSLIPVGLPGAMYYLASNKLDKLVGKERK